MDETAWSHSTFSKNRDRLLAHDVVGELFETVRLCGKNYCCG